MAVFFIAVLYCQYILQLNWLFTVKRLDCFVPEKIFQYCKGLQLIKELKLAAVHMQLVCKWCQLFPQAF